MHFREFGEGPALIILHGLFGSSDNWMTVSRRLGSHFRIYLPDLRNHGQSPHADSHSYIELVSDLELFFKEQQIGKAALLGHSMGGKLAMMFAVKNPSLITSLTIADIAPKKYNRVEENGEDPAQLLSLMENIDLSSCTSRNEIDILLSKEIKSLSLRQFMLKNIYRSKEGQFVWKINVPVLRKFLPEIIGEVNPEFFTPYRPVKAYPVTFIRGLKSGYLQNSDIPLIRDIYPEAKIINIPYAGHWLHAEQPEAFVEAVLASAL